MMDLDPVEVRILGCLIEKQRTTPDTYPLSLNALRLACNQTTNRDPVVQYDETMIREALHRLSQRRYSRLASGHTSRAYKFRHLLDEALGLDEEELAVLGVLLLRGAQTPGELKQRTDRMQGFADLAAVQDAVDRLVERDLVLRLARRPGQKEERYLHRLSEEAEGAPPVEQPPSRSSPLRPGRRRRGATTAASTGSRPSSRSCGASWRRCASSSPSCARSWASNSRP